MLQHENGGTCMAIVDYLEVFSRKSGETRITGSREMRRKTRLLKRNMLPKVWNVGLVIYWLVIGQVSREGHQNLSEST